MTNEETEWLTTYLDSLEEVDKKSDMFRFPFEDDFLSKYRDKFLDNVDVANNLLQAFALVKNWKEIIGTKSHKEELARKFKDNNDPMKIAIVVDMWLTGFDVPSLATMYVYKPIHGYNLMQAIARVNRVFKDKEGGLIVDYVGIASALKPAMKEYTKRDQSKYGDMNIAKMAYPKFQEKLQVCKDLLHGFDFSGFVGGSPLTMAKLISGGVNFILDAIVPERKDLFLKEAMLLKQSHSLCSSMTTEQERHEVAYMEALRSTVIKITYGGTGGKKFIAY